MFHKYTRCATKNSAFLIVTPFLAVTMMCTFLAATCALSTVALAQEPVSSYNYGYYTNANTADYPQAQMFVVNPGSTAGTSPAGDLCANVYVSNSNNEILECCSCKVSPDGLRTFGVNANLTDNSLLTSVPHTGVIKIVSSAVPAPGSLATSCTNVAATTYAPYGYLGTWITHVNEAHNTFSVSETHFLAGVLSTTELTNLQNICSFIQASGAGFGICSCGSE